MYNSAPAAVSSRALQCPGQSASFCPLHSARCPGCPYTAMNGCSSRTRIPRYQTKLVSGGSSGGHTADTPASVRDRIFFGGEAAGFAALFFPEPLAEAAEGFLPPAFSFRTLFFLFFFLLSVFIYSPYPTNCLYLLPTVTGPGKCLHSPCQ